VVSAATEFGLDRARQRPPYQPKRITCPSCGAAQSVADENAQLVACTYCGSHLEVTPSEATVLSGGNPHERDYPIAIGESFRHKGTRYEVIGRIVMLEDGEADEVTRHYLLFNPYRGSLWLAEYGGHYDLSEATHVMPKKPPFTAVKGSDMETWDGRRWVAVETTTSQIAHVDGALPWVAKVGDWVHAAEFVAADGSGDIYEAESTGDEVEYGMGRRIPVGAVNSALGRRDLPEPVIQLEDVIGTRSTYRTVMAVAAVAVVVNLAILAVAAFSGRTVLTQRFAAEDLTREVLSSPFQVARAGDVLRVDIAAGGLDNAWMSLDWAVVQGDDTVVHVDDADIQYYHGREGGESWSEGNRSTTGYVKVPTAGEHRLLLHAVSALGETPSADTCRHDIAVRVVAGARRRAPAVVITILCMVGLVGTFLAYQAWKHGVESSDDDDDD
jgi:hypothetical protein